MILRNSTMASTLLVGALLIAGCSKPSAAPESEARLFFANWEGEIGATTLADFKRDSGISVAAETITDNVILETKLLTGHSGIDVAVPSSNFLAPLIASGALVALDKSKLPNWHQLNPAVLTRLQAVDPGNRYAVPYLWGTYGIAYDTKAVKAALGRDPNDDYELLFSVEVAKRLAACGVAWPDGGGLTMTHLALLALGRDPGKPQSGDLRDAQTLLTAVRPYVRYIDSLKYDSDLASGEICVAAGPSGDMLRARDGAARKPQPTVVRYFVPRGPAMMWIDVLVIPANARNVESAYRFINYLMDPAVIAGITNNSKFPNSIPAADPLLDPALRDDPSFLVPMEVLNRLQLMPSETQEFVRERTRMWTRVRTSEN